MLSSQRSLRAKPSSEAPLLSKFGNLSIQKILVVTSAYVRTASGGGGGKSQDNPTGVENAIFSWREIARCLWATAFFLAGNLKTIVAFEKEVSLKKSLSLFSKTIARQYCSFKLDKKHLIFINGKKKLKRILVEGEKFKLRKLPSKDFIALFSSRRRACLVLKHNRVSEVEVFNYKGFKVHDFEYYGQRNYILKWKFILCH